MKKMNLGRRTVLIDADEVLYATAEFAKDLAKEQSDEKVGIEDLIPFFEAESFYENLPAKYGARAFMETISMVADVHLVCRTPEKFNEIRKAKLMKDFGVEEDHILFTEEPVHGFDIFVSPNIHDSYCKMNIKFDCGWNMPEDFEGMSAESFAEILGICGTVVFDDKKIRQRWL